MPQAALIISAVAAVAGAVASVASAQQQRKIGKYNASVREFEGQVSKYEGQAEAVKLRRAGARRQGEITAAYAEDFDLQGTPSAVLFDQALEDELGAKLKEYEGEMGLLRGKQSATGIRYEAQAGADVTLLKGASDFGQSVGSMYAFGSTNGVF